MAFEISVNEVSESRRDVGITVPRKNYESKMQRAVQALIGRVEIKGFRKGKAPESVVRKMYGDRLKADVMEEIWRDAYRDVVTEKSFEVVGVSKLHFHDENPEEDIKIHAEFAIMPRPELKKLDGLTVQVETEKFTEKLVDEAIDEVLRRSSKVNAIQGRDSAQRGDLVNISFEANIEGEPFSGSKEESSYVEIGSGRSIKDLEEGLIGQKVGETREIAVKFPDDYADQNLAKKTATYQATVKTIEQVELPEFTDAFVKETLNEESVADFKEKLTKRIQRRLDERNHSAQIDAMIKALYEANTFEIPEVMVDEQIRGKLFELGILNPKDENAYRRDVSRFRPLVGEMATKEVTKAIILERLVEQLEVDASDEEVDKWVNTQATRYETTGDQIREEFDFSRDPKRLKDVVRREKAVEQILAKSKVIEQPKA